MDLPLISLTRRGNRSIVSVPSEARVDLFKYRPPLVEAAFRRASKAPRAGLQRVENQLREGLVRMAVADEQDSCCTVSPRPEFSKTVKQLVGIEFAELPMPELRC